MKPLRPQRGVAILAILGMVLLVGAYFVLGSLNFASQRVARDTVTNDALLKAKQALIAYAAADTNRPGELPCPDVNDDGRAVPIEDYNGSNCTSLIGRLPWSTLGLPDLRDEAGERLWYALSDDFHANGTVALNSDTAYRPGNVSLGMSGLRPASNLVAIVFSPGAPLMRQGAAAVQNRSCTVGVNCDADRKCTTVPATNTPKCNPVNYLDITGGEDNSDANRQFVAATASATFNDRLMPIHSDDIMWLVEKRAGREFAQHLRDHYTTWQTAAGKGFYPWAAPFADPSGTYAGASGTEHGLLPMVSPPLTWASASPPLLCSGVGTSTLTCTGLMGPPLLPVLNVTGTIANIGRGFYGAPTTAPPDVEVVAGLALLGSPTASWSVDPATETLNFSYSAGLLSVGLVTIVVRAPTASAWVTGGWLRTNNWHHLTYYAVAPPFTLVGSATCGTCITVANTAAPANKEAVLVMMGRALPGQPQRPLTIPPALNQFLENQNQTPADRLYESSLKAGTFNDLPVVVRP